MYEIEYLFYIKNVYDNLNMREYTAWQTQHYDSMNGSPTYVRRTKLIWRLGDWTKHKVGSILEQRQNNLWIGVRKELQKIIVLSNVI